MVFYRVRRGELPRGLVPEKFKGPMKGRIARETMVKRSKGTRYRTRYKLQKKRRNRGLPTLTRSLHQFSPGDRVNVVIDPSVHKGQPHHRFHGLTGVVKRQLGQAYHVEVRSGRMQKIIIARPEHLNLAK